MHDSLNAPPQTAPSPRGSDVPAGSGWATGLGIVALVYAALGILVNGGGIAMLVFSEEAREAAGGMNVGRVPEMLEVYGRDVILLIGGALLSAGSALAARSREFVDSVRTLSSRSA